ncbi:uncharacterized protein FFB20_14021 [Fusarium fujikuroi]|uniref:Uncharacterized protein n=2 Tax=Fusarium fujikuroi TaxID=5127 RepID=S0DY82_GIBF5|nr:uncharacterized protein FFUJ_03391 [Fusarium fujikuroi IMI 58289]KLO89621.1 uncharacterized protein LW93_1680 [Fusarium fujikuroi]KLP08702.1 uncharacterized protein Y057_7125 [Fusarium fujikuroi]KLP19929.1 uncharacterized protein LW94_1238 [Fusarium fujikuroi]QGI62564.1 hypothetical protein CEK27_006535 [Fusarium fujikuroi]QGI79728.1 hypothetical protein CEK25_006457 [Fusarium fujikuroi]
MDRDDREELSKCLYWSILRITGPPELELPEPRFEITHSVIEKSLALLDPEDFLCQALLYFQNYLQHKELRKHEDLIHFEIASRLYADMRGIPIEDILLEYTTGNWLEELLGTSGEEAVDAAPMDYHESEDQLRTDMDIDIPESGTYQASVVDLLNEARIESQDPTQTARKRHLDNGYDGDESSLQGKKRARILQESYE